MQAFHNDPAVKAKYVARLQAHRTAEHLTQGVGFDRDVHGNTKGCAVGCTLDAYDHSRYPIELGLPEWLARLEDRIFEGLPKGKAEQFAEDFLMAVPVGADVSAVRGKLAVLRLARQLPALAANPELYARQVEEAVKRVIAWHQAGEPEGSAARSAARSAAESAESARSAARSAAESARSAESAAAAAAWSAESAAWSAESAAWSAAESARSAESAAWSAAAAAAARSAASAARSAAESARSAHFEWEAATLLQLLKDSAQ